MLGWGVGLKGNGGEHGSSRLQEMALSSLNFCHEGSGEPWRILDRGVAQSDTWNGNAALAVVRGTAGSEEPS